MVIMTSMKPLDVSIEVALVTDRQNGSSPPNSRLSPSEVASWPPSLEDEVNVLHSWRNYRNTAVSELELWRLGTIFVCLSE